MAVKNLFGKARKPGNAYAVVIAANGWKYEILKLYKSVSSSRRDPYARAFCFVHGVEAEYGDVYLSEIPGAYAVLLPLEYAAHEAKRAEVLA